MDLHSIITWVKLHWKVLILLPGNILMIEAVVRQAAVNHGYKNVVSWCDHIANFVGFIYDIIMGLVDKPQAPRKQTN